MTTHLRCHRRYSEFADSILGCFEIGRAAEIKIGELPAVLITYAQFVSPSASRKRVPLTIQCYSSRNHMNCSVMFAFCYNIQYPHFEWMVDGGGWV